MKESYRFASVQGKARKWLQDCDEVEEVWSDEVDGIGQEASHDGWSPIAPRKRYVQIADLVRYRERARDRARGRRSRN